MWIEIFFPPAKTPVKKYLTVSLPVLDGFVLLQTFSGTEVCSSQKEPWDQSTNTKKSWIICDVSSQRLYTPRIPVSMLTPQVFSQWHLFSLGFFMKWRNIV